MSFSLVLDSRYISFSSVSMFPWYSLRDQWNKNTPILSVMRIFPCDTDWNSAPKFRNERPSWPVTSCERRWKASPSPSVLKRFHPLSLGKIIVERNCKADEELAACSTRHAAALVLQSYFTRTLTLFVSGMGRIDEFSSRRIESRSLLGRSIRQERYQERDSWQKLTVIAVFWFLFKMD